MDKNKKEAISELIKKGTHEKQKKGSGFASDPYFDHITLVNEIERIMDRK